MLDTNNDTSHITEFRDIPCPILSTTQPQWVDNVKNIKGHVYVEMKNTSDLFETIMYITKYVQKRYVVVFNDFDVLLQFLIGFVNVLEISDLYVYGFNYLRFAFPYIKYSHTLELSRDHSVVLTTDKKISSLSKIDVDTIYTFHENESERISHSTITLTTTRLIPHSIKTYDEVMKIRSHRININLSNDNPVNVILDYMIKYNHRKVILFYMDQFTEFPSILSDYKEIEYDSEYDDDHLHNNPDCQIIVFNGKKYGNTGYNTKKIHIYTRGEDITSLTDDKQLLYFYDYKHQKQLFNLLSTIDDTIKTVDIIFSGQIITPIFLEDLKTYKEMFPDKKLHYIFNDTIVSNNDRNQLIKVFDEKLVF